MSIQVTLSEWKDTCKRVENALNSDEEGVEILQDICGLMDNALAVVKEQTVRNKSSPKGNVEKEKPSSTQSDDADGKVKSDKKDNKEEEWKARVTQNEYFLNQSFPRMIKSVMRRRRFAGESTRKTVNDFLKRSIHLILVHLKAGMDHLGLYVCITILFDDEYQFYLLPKASTGFSMSPTSSWDRGGQSGADCDGEYASMAGHPRTSTWLVTNINYFGALGGFELLLRRMKQSQPVFPVLGLNLFLKALWYVRHLLCVENPKMEKFIVTLKNLAFDAKGMILGLDDADFKKHRVAHMVITSDRVASLCRQIFSPVAAGEAQEKFKLGLVNKCLHSESLEKRVDGLKLMNELIDMTLRRETPRGMAGLDILSRTHEPLPVSRWLVSDYLIKFIRSFKIVEILFDSRMHNQLVSRAQRIFLFLAQKRALRDAHLELLWTSSLGKKRDTIVASIYGIFTKLANYLSLSQLLSLIDRIGQVPLEVFDRQTLVLLRTLSLNAFGEPVKGERPNKDFGLQIFWNVLSSEEATTNAQVLSLTYLGDILEQCHNATSFKIPYIVKCIENIMKDQRTAIPQSLLLLQRILGSFPNQVVSRTQPLTRSLFIERLETKYHLLDLLIEELGDYKSSVFDLMKSGKLKVDSASTKSSAVMIGKRSHAEHMKCRLDTIKFLLTYSSLSFSEENVDAIWPIFTDRAVTEDELRSNYKWLEALVISSARPLVETSVSTRFFSYKLCKMDPAKVTLPAFLCFQTYFCFINGLANRLENWAELHHFVVLDLKLIGLQSLWNIVLLSTNKEVQSASVTYLNGIYRRISPSLQARTAELRHSYVSSILDHLGELGKQAAALESGKKSSSSAGSSASSNNSQSPHQASVSTSKATASRLAELDALMLRAVNVLEQFVIEYEPRRGVDVAGTPVRLTLRQQQRGGVTLIGDYFSGDTIGFVRDELADRINKPLNALYFIIEDGDSLRRFKDSEYECTLEEMGFHVEGAVLRFQLDPHLTEFTGVRDFRPPDEEEPKDLPSFMLADNQQFFDQLWKLLERSSATSSATWELISKLPTNPKITSKLTNLSSHPKWRKLLDSHSVFRLCYALRIVNSMLTLPDLNERDAWCQRFFESGGLEHVYSLLFGKRTIKASSQSSSTQQSVALTCVSSLLKVFNYFVLRDCGDRLTVRADLTNTERTAWLSLPQVVSQLVKLVVRSARNTSKTVSELDARIAEHAGELLLACICSNPSLLASSLLSHAKLKQFVRAPLLDSVESGIRDVAARTLYFLCVQLDKPTIPHLMAPPPAAAVADNHSQQHGSDVEAGHADGEGKNVHGPSVEAKKAGEKARACFQPMLFGFLTNNLPRNGNQVDQYFALLCALVRASCIRAGNELHYLTTGPAARDNRLHPWGSGRARALAPDAMYAFEDCGDVADEELFADFIGSDEEGKDGSKDRDSDVSSDTDSNGWSSADEEDADLRASSRLRRQRRRRRRQLQPWNVPMKKPEVVDEERFEEYDTCAKKTGQELFADVKEVLLRVAGLIQDHRVLEADDMSTSQTNHTTTTTTTTSSSSSVMVDEGDRVLVGLLALTEALCSAAPHLPLVAGSAAFGNLIEEVFVRCLFALPSAGCHGANAPPKAKQPRTRRAAFRLLRRLAAGCVQNYVQLLDLVRVHHVGNPPAGQWGYLPSSARRSSTGYVGIRNLGCICYMNSMMQQLFMMPHFRKGILSLALPRKTGSGDGGDADTVGNSSDALKEDLMYQMQVMFSYLQESQKQFYNPRPFCNANKDSQGRATNTALQMDVDEFFNHLCDKMERALRGTPQEHLMRDIWQGELVSQLICKGCPHRSERPEPFHVVTVGIKGKNTLKEALEAYVEGDWLEGENAYFCEKCDQKRDTLKRTCLAKLPNTLILHLKRFDFNFDSMQNEKVNTFCEFPTELNMEPYTAEGLARRDAEKQGNQPSSGQDEEEAGKEGDHDDAVVETTAAGADDEKEDEAEDDVSSSSSSQQEGSARDVKLKPAAYYEYELKGVVIHRGIAESGHYYSFIKERVPANGRTEPQWFEFNDELVQPFNHLNLPAECYGGRETVYRWSNYHKQRVKKHTYRNRNAYMLIYERKNPIPVSSSTSAEKSAKTSTAAAAAALPAAAVNETQQETDGVTSMSSSTHTSSGSKSKKKKSKKKSITSLSASPDSRSDGDSSSSSSNKKRNKNARKKEARAHAKKREQEYTVSVPATLYEAVWEDNMRYLRDMRAFDSTYISFLYDLLRMSTATSVLEYTDELCLEDESTRQLELFAQIFLDLLCHSREKLLVKLYSIQLQRLMRQNVSACRWLLHMLVDTSKAVHDHLLHCSVNSAREAFAALALCAVRTLRPLEVVNHDNFYDLSLPPVRAPRAGDEKYDDDDDDDDDGDDDEDENDHDMVNKKSQKEEDETSNMEEGSKSNKSGGRPVVLTSSGFQVLPLAQRLRKPAVRRFVDTVLELLRFAVFSWRHFSEYFLVLRELAMLGAEEREYFLKKGVHISLLGLFLGKDSPFGESPVKCEMGDKFDTPDFTHLLSTLAILTCSCETPARLETRLRVLEADGDAEAAEKAALEIPPSPVLLSKNSLKFNLSDLYEETLISSRFMFAVIRSQAHLEHTAKILMHCSWYRENVSESIVYLLTQGIHDAEFDGIRPFGAVLNMILGLDDPVSELRAHLACSRIIDIAIKYKKYPKFTKTTLQHLMLLRRQHPAVKTWMDHHPDRWSWVSSWLNIHAEELSGYEEPYPKCLPWRSYKEECIEYGEDAELWQM